MTDATVIYPHQLFSDHPTIASGRRVYLVEEPLLLTHNPIHRQKLIFHKLSLDAYERSLRNAGHEVRRLTIAEHPNSAAVFVRLTNDGVRRMHIADTTDDYLEQAIGDSGIARIWYESPLFLTSRADATERYRNSKRFMATFYKRLRRDRNILIDEHDEPVGGQWSFDTDNRKALPADYPLPDDLRHFGNGETAAAEAWARNVDAEQYGEPGCWLPYTHDGARTWLSNFLAERLADFGPYEDALSTRGVRLFHSALSPLLNAGLLTPAEVLDAALEYGANHNVALNSLEGFVRQILGWREFIRAAYECDGRAMRSRNFWKHGRTLPDHFWRATTGIVPVDHVITTALAHGYTHHIERLMVMGNFMLLSRLHPAEVYRWFMGMYVDAYDWVMVPNVYGMSQFADGGRFATKPYISGANYLRKMSDFPRGDWEATWTALYWSFIAAHNEFFRSNHRLAMMPRLLDRMNEATRSAHLARAREFLQGLDR
ncbi:MAG: deoxyribodipyrimidine photolyase [Spirochaetes bacterium]|jgi:deoxyribodipyrimidine photolyase-related protein|nr:deoxyribodipyrimidine photolyase [Spirochaetota bacterium]